MPGAKKIKTDHESQYPHIIVPTYNELSLFGKLFKRILDEYELRPSVERAEKPKLVSLPKLVELEVLLPSWEWEGSPPVLKVRSMTWNQWKDLQIAMDIERQILEANKPTDAWPWENYQLPWLSREYIGSFYNIDFAKEGQRIHDKMQRRIDGTTRTSSGRETANPGPYFSGDGWGPVSRTRSQTKRDSRPGFGTNTSTDEQTF